ncbi:putative poly(ADP-ribose) polymerase, catalytic domain, RST domain-containing protein [Helianthus annuus]|nr:putative poly(ADP-ribose) polymerase, catalytic domain, RST domain-containing protein [Helianthus annuus]
MASKWVKVSDSGSRTRVIFNPKRKRASQIVKASTRALAVRPSPVLNRIGKRKRDESCNSKCISSSSKTLLKYYSNLMKTGVPQHMETGVQKPIAWIDETENDIQLVESESCTTPEVKLHVEIELNGLNNNNVEECMDESYIEESNIKRVKLDHNVNDTCKTLLEPETVRNMFIKGINPAFKADIIDVKKCSGDIMESMLELFEKQVEITQKLRGNANVKYAWFASSTNAPSSIVAYGLGHDGPKLGKYGYGVHLTAVDSAQNSATICDVDEKGVRCMVLCRVILGNMELVFPGSKQFYPSDDCFDTGVDNLDNPNHYVVWNMNINTHIYPEYAVSFKISPSAEDGNRVNLSSRVTTEDAQGPSQIDSSSSSKLGNMSVEKVPSVGSSASRAPKSPWMPFSKLFEAISDKVSPDDMKLVHILYESLKGKKTSREEFIRKLRLIVGDQILRSTISSLQSAMA